MLRTLESRYYKKKNQRQDLKILHKFSHNIAENAPGKNEHRQVSQKTCSRNFLVSSDMKIYIYIYIHTHTHIHK